MFRNVDAELKRKGMTRADLAAALGIRPSTLSFKMNGKSAVTLPEAVKIKEILAVNIPLEELFEETRPSA